MDTIFQIKNETFRILRKMFKYLYVYPPDAQIFHTQIFEEKT